jgi:hypothetical protein
VTVPAVTVKLPVADPAATVADAGVVSAALLSETVTLMPPVGAAADKVTLQVEVPPDTTLVGEHARLETTGSTAVWTEMAPPLAETATPVPLARDPMTLLTETGTELALVAES